MSLSTAGCPDEGVPPPGELPPSGEPRWRSILLGGHNRGARHRHGLRDMGRPQDLVEIGTPAGGQVIFLVTIQDKTLYGEPDVASAVVDAPDKEVALRAAWPTIDRLANAARGRCVPHALAIELGKFYRLGALVRLPRDVNTEEDSRG